ncbi:hypothetical protein [Streptomyces antarcticus]|uniref:hypothetical protein n=1 Tax=Streptomyces antarcticus TaxID=2996458 RepID=UPI002270FA58|nr:MULTISPECIES: hypothetical protein [unclassified Streptomyces]MCY0943562.1 hypothetical protein [Streptomyces sp. H34-AA3]MCZ4083529.1 hypothetical protein [Streptomyces sp. H34-S5]
MTACLLCEQPDDTGGYLCPACTKATVRQLLALPSLYNDLLPFLAPGSGGGATRRAAAVSAPMPVSEMVLSLRGPGGIVGVAEDWAGAVRAARRMKPAVPVGAVPTRLSAAVRELVGHMPWIAVSWPDAGTFAQEIRDLGRDIASIVDPGDREDRGTRLGACPAVDVSGVICGAVLRHRPGTKVVACDWCECTYPPATWPGLKTWMEHDEQEAIAS